MVKKSTSKSLNKKKVNTKVSVDSCLDSIGSVISLANRFVNFGSKYNSHYKTSEETYLLYEIRSFKHKLTKNNSVFEEVKKTFEFNVNANLKEMLLSNPIEDDDRLFN